MAMTQKEYWDDINGIVESIKEAVKEHGQDPHEALHESIDGHSLIIYYANIPYVFVYTDNIDAIMDQMGEIPSVSSGGTVYDALIPIAYYAVYADVTDKIDFDELEDEDNPRRKKRGKKKAKKRGKKAAKKRGKKAAKKRGKKAPRKNPAKVKGVRSLVSSALK